MATTGLGRLAVLGCGAGPDGQVDFVLSPENCLVLSFDRRSGTTWHLKVSSVHAVSFQDFQPM